eukprot:366350-Alexandrium_andersonii.AAC.1
MSQPCPCFFHLKASEKTKKSNNDVTPSTCRHTNTSSTTRSQQKASVQEEDDDHGADAFEKHAMRPSGWNSRSPSRSN